MDIEILLTLWAKNIGRVKEGEILRTTGQRTHGIEYRIMLEGGAAQLSSPGYQDQLISDIDRVWTLVHRRHPEHMIAIKEYFKREVLPYAPEAWIDEKKTKKGYEIPMTRYFYEYQAPEPVEEIAVRLHELELEIQSSLDRLFGGE